MGASPAGIADSAGAAASRRVSGPSCDNLPVDEVAAGEHATESDVAVATPEPVTPADAAPSGPGESRFARITAGWGLPEGALAVLVVAWSIEFIKLPMERFDRWGTFGFDLGIYDQGTWLLSRAKDPFVTIRGLELFGHHANVFLLLLVPFYWLGAGPIFLLVVQVLAQASGAIAVFLLARDLLRSKWAGVVLAAALLLNPTYQWLTWEFFHPDAVAIGPLLFAYWAAREKRWRLFTVAAVLAVLCKEDLAIAVAILGLIVAFRGDEERRDRRRALDRLLLLRDPGAHPRPERHRALLRQLLRRSGQEPDRGRLQLGAPSRQDVASRQREGPQELVLQHVRPVGVRAVARHPRARGRGRRDLHQHRLVVPVHTRLPVPLFGDRRRGERGGDRRGDRLDLEPRQATGPDPGRDAVRRARPPRSSRALPLGCAQYSKHYKDGPGPGTRTRGMPSGRRR